MTARDRFHKHLDEHQQCRENPFSMCPIGNQLLEEAGQEAAEAVRSQQLGFPMPGDKTAKEKT